jgi:hypothetical protein
LKKNLELHRDGCYEGNWCLTGGVGVEGFFTCI